MTIDEAQAAMTDPSHPRHGEMVWRADRALKGLQRWSVTRANIGGTGPAWEDGLDFIGELYDAALKYVDVAVSRDELLIQEHERAFGRDHQLRGTP